MVPSNPELFSLEFRITPVARDSMEYDVIEDDEAIGVKSGGIFEGNIRRLIS